MHQDIHYQKIMAMLNKAIQEMKYEMNVVDDMHLQGEQSLMAQTMHQILEQIETKTDDYATSHAQEDFNSVCQALEVLKPSFVINYNEICYEDRLHTLEAIVQDMEHTLSQVQHLDGINDEDSTVYDMNRIYDQVAAGIKRFCASHTSEDYQDAMDQIETLQPEFILNYNALIL